MIDRARQQYLANEVLSASPQKLRKLLLDGAIRFAQETLHHWSVSDFESGLESTNRTRDILIELLVTIQDIPENKPIMDLYRFLNREINLASFERSQERLRQIVRVLTVEQETWALVCEQVRSNMSSAHEPAVPFPHFPAASLPTTHVPGSFSFEA
jgi:flagellin-specific chaperone FliS